MQWNSCSPTKILKAKQLSNSKGEKKVKSNILIDNEKKKKLMMKKVTEVNWRRNEQCERDLEVTMQSVIKTIAEIVTSECDKKICLDMFS